MTEDLNNNEEYDYLEVEKFLSKDKRLEVRQIIQELRNFRISQKQILFLIELLALELEDREKMVSITNAIKQYKKENNEEKEIELILPKDAFGTGF